MEKAKNKKIMKNKKLKELIKKRKIKMLNNISLYQREIAFGYLLFKRAFLGLLNKFVNFEKLTIKL